jgi:hypothetical protein
MGRALWRQRIDGESLYRSVEPEEGTFTASNLLAGFSASVRNRNFALAPGMKTQATWSWVFPHFFA